LNLEAQAGALVGPASARFPLVDEYLAYLGDRNYSPKTVRGYGFDLLAFCRRLVDEDIELAAAFN
jgi:integrase/recombinase XerD